MCVSGEGNGNLLYYSCLENPMDRGAWQATVYGVTRITTTEQLSTHTCTHTHTHTHTSRINTPKKDVLFITGGWNAKVGSQEKPGVTGKFGLRVQNGAGQRLTEFCQENVLVIANTLF